MKNYVTNEMMEAISTYMDDEKRELIHNEISPCTNVEFLKKYLEIDPGFSELLETEFSVESNNLKELRDLSVEELKELDMCFLNDDDFENLQENPEVLNVECLGQSGYYKNSEWYDIQLSDGYNIDVYSK